MENKKGFNLLRPQVEPKSKWDRIYDWVSNTSRVVIIVVQVIVLGCFAFRIFIDRQARSLENTLQDNKNYLDSLKPDEERIRELMQAIEAYNVTWGNASMYSPLIEEIYSYDESIVSDIRIDIQRTGISIDGTATIEKFGNLESDFKNSESFILQKVPNYVPEGEQESDLAQFKLEGNLKKGTRESLEQLYPN